MGLNETFIGRNSGLDFRRLFTLEDKATFGKAVEEENLVEVDQDAADRPAVLVEGVYLVTQMVQTVVANAQPLAWLLLASGPPASWGAWGVAAPAELLIPLVVFPTFPCLWQLRHQPQLCIFPG